MSQYNLFKDKPMTPELADYIKYFISLSDIEKIKIIYECTLNINIDIQSILMMYTDYEIINICSLVENAIYTDYPDLFPNELEIQSEMLEIENILHQPSEGYSSNNFENLESIPDFNCEDMLGVSTPNNYIETTEPPLKRGRYE